ncbi:MAG TPA: hypothetical protein VK144_08295 [Bacillota bacterium]|nr:hypothetical protein [Bacillota bacterium]
MTEFQNKPVRGDAGRFNVTKFQDKPVCGDAGRSNVTEFQDKPVCRNIKQHNIQVTTIRQNPIIGYLVDSIKLMDTKKR